MKTGKIVLWNFERGFGFIEITNGNGKRYFAHIRNWTDTAETPSVNAAVCFDVGPAYLPGKPEQAVNIRPLDFNAGLNVLKAGV